MSASNIDEVDPRNMSGTSFNGSIVEMTQLVGVEPRSHWDRSRSSLFIVAMVVVVVVVVGVLMGRRSRDREVLKLAVELAEARRDLNSTDRRYEELYADLGRLGDKYAGALKQSEDDHVRVSDMVKSQELQVAAKRVYYPLGHDGIARLNAGRVAQSVPDVDKTPRPPVIKTLPTMRPPTAFQLSLIRNSELGRQLYEAGRASAHSQAVNQFIDGHDKTGGYPITAWAVLALGGFAGSHEAAREGRMTTPWQIAPELEKKFPGISGIHMHVDQGNGQIGICQKIFDEGFGFGQTQVKMLAQMNPDPHKALFYLAYTAAGGSVNSTLFVSK